jgi:hypothetical protein
MLAVGQAGGHKDQEEQDHRQVHSKEKEIAVSLFSGG